MVIWFVYFLLSWNLSRVLTCPTLPVLICCHLPTLTGFYCCTSCGVGGAGMGEQGGLTAASPLHHNPVMPSLEIVCM